MSFTNKEVNPNCEMPQTGNENNILIQMMDMFGNLVPKRILNTICAENNWDLNNSTQEVIKYIDNNNLDRKVKFSKNTGKSTINMQNQFNASKNLGAIPKRYGDKEKSKSLENKTPTKTIKGIYDKRESESVENLVNNIIKGLKVMIIMRGVPGCGKTFLAKEIINKTLKSCNYTDHIFSTDNYFYDLSGEYKYDSNYLKEAHECNQKKVFEKINAGWSPIIVDNTNIKLWEMVPYARVAFKHGYLVYILEPQTSWAFSAKILAKKNVHNVPKENIERMLNNFESGNAVFLKQLKKEYKSVVFPQIRKFPPLPYSETHPDNQNFIEQDDNKIQVVISDIFNEDNENQIVRPLNKHSINSNLDYSCTVIQQNTNLPKSLNTNKCDLVEDFDKFVKISDNSNCESEKKNFENDESDPFAPKPQRQKKRNHLIEALKDPPTMKIEKEIQEVELKSNPTKLVKHKIGCPNECEAFTIVRQIFPNEQVDSLWDLFEKCQGDANWMIDILFKDDSSVDYYSNSDGNINYDDFNCSCDSTDTTAINDTNITSENKNIDEKSCHSKNSQRKLINNNYISEEDKLRVKKEIESQFILGDNCYSEYLKKVRSYKRTDTNDNAKKKSEIDSENSNIETETISNTVTETDEIVSSESDANEMVEISLGAELVGQLDRMFGNEVNDKPTNYLTNVFMPKSLAQQLYIIWLESFFNQKEEQRRETVKADEEFARLLTDPKNNNDQCPNNFQEFLDMEKAWDDYKSEHQTSNWKNLVPTDLASHLSRMKLYERFPDLEKETLLEIYASHNFDYFNTVDFLKKSIFYDEDSESDNKKKLEKENSEEKIGSDKQGSKTQLTKLKIVDKKLSAAEGRRISLQQFEENRNLAVHYNQLKSECYQKAKEAIQKDNGAVAVYYSEIAKLHRNKAEMCNHKAANSIMAVHDISQTDPDFIDLHYLHVNEALECLDYFIDKHISKINNIQRSYKNIFIITGRGLHSSSGIAAIKGRVKSRLKERFLTWSEVNPGLLKVKVFATSMFSKIT